ncbi:MAG: glycosyltransferase family 2 protein [Campylobacterales bacterium]|nr:glycosyltransferase family 2 protein [Campylobacterales bacterium]
MLNKKVYIILLNYNGWKDTIECLESVLKNDYENYQIIVVDNDSPNNSMEYIKAWAEGKQEVIYDENSQLKHLSQPYEPKPLDYVYYTKEEALSGGDQIKESEYNNPLIFIQAGENGGFAAGNNIGIKYALEKDDFEYVWLLNNDTVIERDSLNCQIKYFESNKNSIGILGSMLYFYYNQNVLQGIGGRYNPFTAQLELTKDLNKQESIDYIIGASMFVSKNFINKVGLMEEKYFLYFEELDWAIRGKNKNFTSDVCRSSIVYHKEGASIGSNQEIKKQSLLSTYYMINSHMKFTESFYSQYIFIFYIRYLLRICSAIFIKKDFKRAILIFDIVFENNSFDEIQRKYS